MQSNQQSWPSDAVPAPALCGDAERARVLAAYGFDSLEDDRELAAIAGFAARLCEVPVALVTLVESERQRFLARQGIDQRETPRSTSMCAHAMMEGSVLVVPDATRDPRFAEFDLVNGEFGLRFYAGAPLVSHEGAPIGALCVIDTQARPEGLSELQREGLEVLARAVMRRLGSQRELLEVERRAARRGEQMRTLADWLPNVIYSSDGEGRFDYFNGRWQQVTGSQPPSDTEGWRPFVHEDDQDAAFGKWQDSNDRGEAFETSYRLRQADGGWRWTMSRALPVKDERGRVQRWYGTLTDVDDAHRESDNRDVLTHELAHRIKNVFAVISGLVSVRTRGRPELRAFGEEFVATINALGRAQDFVQPDPERGGGDLKGLVELLLAPFAGEGDARIEVSGHGAAVGARSATPVALIVHELATNSLKYGALSAAAGRIAIRIAVDGDDLVLEWIESGGPATVEPEGRRGFGTRLIDLSVSSQLGGTIVRDWRPGGLAVTLRLPKERLAG